MVLERAFDEVESNFCGCGGRLDFSVEIDNYL